MVEAKIYIRDRAYNFESERVFALLPDKIAKENDCEIIVRSDKAAEEANKLIIRICLRGWPNRVCLFYD